MQSVELRHEIETAKSVIALNLILCSKSHSQMNLACEKSFANFLTVGRQRRVSNTIRRTTKLLKVPGSTWQNFYQTDSVCVCGWEARKPFGTGLKAGNPSRVNKSSPWGTVFPGALCDVWMWTQTSLHYVATALEPLVLGERPCHWQPWPAGRCRRLLLLLSLSLFSLPPVSDPFLHTDFSF